MFLFSGRRIPGLARLFLSLGPLVHEVGRRLMWRAGWRNGDKWWQALSLAFRHVAEWLARSHGLGGFCVSFHPFHPVISVSSRGVGILKHIIICGFSTDEGGLPDLRPPRRAVGLPDREMGRDAPGSAPGRSRRAGSAQHHTSLVTGPQALEPVPEPLDAPGPCLETGRGANPAGNGYGQEGWPAGNRRSV
jgi:hypothetical protein